LVPLVAYDFLDGHVATICSHLHFTQDGLFVINCSTQVEDILHT